MAHRTPKSGYAQLVDRLNRFPQGAPPSDLLYSILRMLFSEKEAALVSLLPIKPFTARKAARLWKMETAAAEEILDELASRAILLDCQQGEDRSYVLPPPMAGFFEFSMMRLRGDIDQKALGELFYQYLNVEEEFIRALFTDGETQLGRVFVQEAALSQENALHVLDYERATEVIKSASHIGIGLCYCRHKMQHVGRACDAPLDICMTFNGAAEPLIRHGHVRRVEASECLDLLQEAYDHRLVQFGENVKEGANFICNCCGCCGCCCEAMLAAKRFGVLHPVHTTNFLPVVDAHRCSGCGGCALICPVNAMQLVPVPEPGRPNRKRAQPDEGTCLGCGVCVRSCPSQSISLKSRAERVITPVNSVHRTVAMAIERGKLQNLIFDEQALASHRAMAAILGAILRLPPVHRVMASQQVKSRYLEALLRRIKVP